MVRLLRLGRTNQQILYASFPREEVEEEDSLLGGSERERE